MKDDGRDRLFFAIRPPADVIAYINEVRPPPRAGDRIVPDDHLHITIFMLGDFNGLPAPLLERAVAITSAQALPSFRVVLTD